MMIEYTNSNTANCTSTKALTTCILKALLKNWPITTTSGVALLWHKSGQLHENSAITHHAAFQIKNPEL